VVDGRRRGAWARPGGVLARRERVDEFSRAIEPQRVRAPRRIPVKAFLRFVQALRPAFALVRVCCPRWQPRSLFAGVTFV
jgi:hypothetical protein